MTTLGLKTGVTLTSSGGVVTNSLPLDTSGRLPRFVRVTATAPCYVRFSDAGTSAVAGDMLVQPSDAAMACVTSMRQVSMLPVSGAATLIVSADESGSWEYESNPELVTNGTFNTSISGWTDGSTAPASISWDSGTQSMLFSGTSGVARGQQAITTVTGRTYTVNVSATPNGVTPTFAVGTGAGGSNILGSQSMPTVGSYQFTFVATGATAWLNFGAPVSGTNTARIDNVSAK